MVDLSIFTKGARIEIRRPARPYTHMGYTDPGCIIPASVEIVTVRAKRQTKNGLKVHFLHEGQTTGYAIDVEKTETHTFRLLPEITDGH